MNDAQGHDAGGSRPARPRYTFLGGSLAVRGVSLCVLRVAAASQSGDPAAAEAARTLWQTVGIWVAALMTLGIFSHFRFMMAVRGQRDTFIAEGLLPQKEEFPLSLTLVTAILLVLIGVAAGLSVIFRSGPF